jgi:Na+/phosphate symporter
MMIELGVILLLVWCHFVGDFILQTSYMATNKSKSNRVLTTHVLVYSLPFLLFGPLFALITMVLHFMTDWVTSRITSKLWWYEDKHWFFVVVGADQAIHFTCLFGLYYWMFT